MTKDSQVTQRTPQLPPLHPYWPTTTIFSKIRRIPLEFLQGILALAILCLSESGQHA